LKAVLWAHRLVEWWVDCSAAKMAERKAEHSVDRLAAQLVPRSVVM